MDLSLIAVVSTSPLGGRASSVSSSHRVDVVSTERIKWAREKFQFAPIAVAEQYRENIEVIEFAESVVGVGHGGDSGLIDSEVQVAKGCR
jgi:hypothetical protein